MNSSVGRQPEVITHENGHSAFSPSETQIVQVTSAEASMPKSNKREPLVRPKRISCPDGARTGAPPIDDLKPPHSLCGEGRFKIPPEGHIHNGLEATVRTAPSAAFLGDVLSDLELVRRGAICIPPSPVQVRRVRKVDFIHFLFAALKGRPLMRPSGPCLNKLPLSGRSDFEKHHYQQARDEPEHDHYHRKCKHRAQPVLGAGG
jgi:hypothetical protein